jgi:hypothetical protein
VALNRKLGCIYTLAEQVFCAELLVLSRSNFLKKLSLKLLLVSHEITLFATATLLATFGFLAPTQSSKYRTFHSTTPSSQTPTNFRSSLEACSRDAADTLPNPYRDVSPSDWAYKAVLSMYYCGAYRGSISPAKVKPFLEQQVPRSSNPTETRGEVSPN